MVQGKEKTMQEKRQVLIQLRKGDSVRKVSRDLRMHRSIVSSIYKDAIKNGWLNPNGEMPDDSTIARCGSQHQPCHQLDAYTESIRQWCLEGMTAVVIQRLLKEKHIYNCKIGALRRYIRKTFQKPPEPVMIRQTTPGDMEVDFGFLGYLWDEHIKKFRKAWVFSARLRHSRKAYREIVWKQDTLTFLSAHVHAFRHFGGVPNRVVLDNLKAGVIKSCIDNDMINRAYGELAEYYGFLISPCLPRTPQHKGGVENDIKYIKRNFWPEIRERQKSTTKLSLTEAQEAIDKWDREVANVRKVHGIGRTPEEIFSSEEKYTLKHLPESDWEPIEWQQCIVGRDWRITCRGAYYSVPYAFIGQTVQVRISLQQVHVFFDYQQIAHHSKATVKGQYQRNSDHAPPFKEAVLSCTREGLLFNAEELGPHVRELCEKILSDPHVDKLRPVRLLLQLALKYEKSRIDRACARALVYNTIRYCSVKDILEKGLDQEPLCPDNTQLTSLNFRFARDPSEYQCINGEMWISAN
jgi:transposase